MQGGHGYGGYGYGGYGYDAGAYSSAAGYGSAGGYYSTGEPPAPVYGDPLDGLELQPSETCPRNYVVFDHTCTESRVMFHPSLAHKLAGSSGYGGCYGTSAAAGGSGGACSARRKEDAEEIDALLSSEDDDDDDDVASTGRSRDGSSPDSACSAGKPRKKERVKKMMRRLKGIIPGGDRMDTPAVLDEVVRHLKSLKVEAKKLGVHASDT